MAQSKYVDVPLKYYLLISRIAHDAYDDLQDILIKKALYDDELSLKEYNMLSEWKLWEQCQQERGLLRE